MMRAVSSCYLLAGNQQNAGAPLAHLSVPAVHLEARQGGKAMALASSCQPIALTSMSLERSSATSSCGDTGAGASGAPTDPGLPGPMHTAEHSGWQSSKAAPACLVPCWTAWNPMHQLDKDEDDGALVVMDNGSAEAQAAWVPSATRPATWPAPLRRLRSSPMEAIPEQVRTAAFLEPSFLCMLLSLASVSCCPCCRPAPPSMLA